MPSILANEYEANNGDMDKVVVKGNDIDLQFYKSGNITTMVALWLGNGTFEITELDDNANIFPEYIEGDVVSIDALKKVLFQSINSSVILSYSLKGRLRDKLNDSKNKFKQDLQKRTDEKVKGMQNKVDWFTDNLSVEQAQEFIRKQPGFKKAKVGAVELTDNDGGKTYKAIVGNPEDKTYSLWQIRRNGNELRTLTAEIGLEKDKVLEKYFKLKTVDDTYQIEDEDTHEVETGIAEEIPEPETMDSEPNVINLGDETSVDDKYNDDIYLPEEDYDIVDNSLKRKKKSKYNGCNVTGCDDGNLSAGNGTAPVVCNLIEW